MSVSNQHQNAPLRLVAAEDSLQPDRSDGLRDRVLHQVIAAGRHRDDPLVTSRAIMTSWQWHACRPIAERRTLQDDLRVAIARGLTTARAWLPLAVAEIEPTLLRDAVAGYVGSSPRGAEAREQALDDVVEWFRRDLTLDRVAVFEALLALCEPAVNARLMPLRGRLTAAERDRVWGEFAAATDVPTREFFAHWAGDGLAAPGHPD